MDIKIAKLEISKLKNETKYGAMIGVASIITKLLEKYRIKPIIVGGLSVQIYTQQDYATRDIDFVSDGYERITELMLSLEFSQKGRHFYHETIEVAVEIPDNHLAGDYEKVVRVNIDDDRYIYLISIEDIILDRIRAGVHWGSEEDQIWAFKMLSSNIDTVDKEYLRLNTEDQEELNLLNKWLIKLNVNV